MHPTSHAFAFPPFEKGGQGGFALRAKSKSPSIPLFQRGRLMALPHIYSTGPHS